MNEWASAITGSAWFVLYRDAERCRFEPLHRIRLRHVTVSKYDTWQRIGWHLIKQGFPMESVHALLGPSEPLERGMNRMLEHLPGPDPT
jgi:hypothetical protein